MTFRDIDAATEFGCLDVDAIADGTAFGALQGRVMGRQANRLLQKRHQILNLMWPAFTTTINDNAQYVMEVEIAPSEALMLPGVPMLKKPGITSGTAYLRLRAPSSIAYTARVGTLAVDRYGQQEGSATGTGSWQWVEIPITLRPGFEERCTVYLHPDGAVGALMDTTTYGSPNTGGVVGGRDILYQSVLEYHGTGVTWDDDIPLDGHVIRWLKNDVVVADKRITNTIDHGNHHTITFDPLTDSQYGTLMSSVRLTSGVEWEIRSMPWIAVAQVLVVTDERSF